MAQADSNKRYTSLKDFYPYYLSEHQHTTTRVLHFMGTGLLLLVAVLAIVLGKYNWLWLCMGRALLL